MIATIKQANVNSPATQFHLKPIITSNQTTMKITRRYIVITLTSALSCASFSDAKSMFARTSEASRLFISDGYKSQLIAKKSARALQ